MTFLAGLVDLDPANMKPSGWRASSPWLLIQSRIVPTPTARLALAPWRLTPGCRAVIGPRPSRHSRCSSFSLPGFPTSCPTLLTIMNPF